ncbi:vinculin [Capsaspora owczarzaki ATCC 30864]|uniref:Vinculin n=1 Tax=Capsaspora owczarzaki (strain ATCC 30864) TaxID=595528 RepID=A0A0D2WSN3_CAPO3|nr:vinculin [Capsaspora owczarzaki ATCC 30864]KJE94488.1 vinculin [Capsaspora owczarzaki ATCC 30864]|eukprot:XP_004346808.1 vinculin [Capsaspora owczarzaki ATCC 30864]
MPLVPVYTQTVESVLLGIGEGITQLMIIQEQAAKANAAMPDLTGPAASVSAAILNLAKEARSLSEETDDEQVRVDLKKASTIVDQAVNDLNSAAAKLKAAPTDKTASLQLVEGGRGTVNGTAALLDAFDQSDVRNILKQAQVVLSQLETMRPCKTEAALVDGVRTISTQLLDLAQLTEERQQSLTLAKLKQELVDANDVLRNQSPSILLALKLYIMNQSSPDTATNRDNSFNRLRDSVNEITRLVQLKYYGVDDKANPTMGTAFESLQMQVARIAANPNLAAAALAPHGDFARQLDVIVQQAQQQANAHASSPMRADILGHMQRVQAIRDEAAQLAERIKANPSDEVAQARFAELMDELPRELRLLEKALADDAIHAQMAVFANVAEPLSAIVQAAQSGNAADVNAAGVELQSQTATLVKASRTVASNAPDSEVSKEINTLSKQLEDLVPQIVVAARLVAANPDDQAARANLDLLMKSWDSKVARLNELSEQVAQPHAFLEVAERTIAAEVAKAKAAVTAQDKPSFDKAVKNIKATAARAGRLAAAEEKNTDDADFRKKMAERRARIEASINGLEPTMNKAFTSRNAADIDAAVQPVTSSVSELKKEIAQSQGIEASGSGSGAGAAGAGSSQAGSASSTAIANEVRKSEEKQVAEIAAAAGVSPQAVASHPISIAAGNLKLVASRWDAKNNALVQAADKISEKMRTMAAFSMQPNNKKDMIDMAKSMASEVAEIVKLAKAAAEQCSDRRLKANLLQLCDKIPTISTQLRIIASVKAANPSDSDAETQLIAGSKNLMDVVTEIVKGTEAASLKSFSSVASTANVALQWKRKALGH